MVSSTCWLVLALVAVASAQDLTGYSVGGITADFFLPHPYLVINPTTSEVALGWTCFALYTILFLSAIALYFWEGGRKIARKRSMASGRSVGSQGSVNGNGEARDAGSITFYVSPFLFAAAAFCMMRMIQISVQLAVELLRSNMIVAFIFESFGNVLFLLSFTFVALLWCNMIIRADIYKEHFARLKIALWVLWAFVSVDLLIAMMCFVIPLGGQNFGAGAHDGFILYPENKTAIVITPVNNVMQKPQASIITATGFTHYSLMCEKGFYACYGFILGVLFTLLAALIIHKMVKSNKALGGSDGAKEKKLRRTIIAILFVAIPVSLCFAVIFIFSVLEVATHRHGNRYETYITQNLCSEIIALTFLMIHYWRAGLRSYIRERRESYASSAASLKSKGGSVASGVSRSDMDNSGASGASARDDDDVVGEGGEEFGRSDVGSQWHSGEIDMQTGLRKHA